MPKKPQRIPELLTREEVRRILEACANPKHRMLLQTVYGCFLANRCRREKLARIRRALAAPTPAPTGDTAATDPPGYPCPRCRRGRLQVIAVLVPQPSPAWVPPG